VSWRVICEPYGHELEKPEAATSGFMQELPQASGSSHTIPSFYCTFRLFARPEACPNCYSFLFNVDGAISIFVSAEAVLEDRPIVVMNAVVRESAKIIARPKENTARPKRAKRTTVNLKTVADTAIRKENQKTWMMQLQHPGAHGL
jgi:hypothetical protein